jgi:Flp pilus assembly protein TadB
MYSYFQVRYGQYTTGNAILLKDVYMFAGVVARLNVLVILTLVISMLVLVVLIAILALFFWYIRQQKKQSPIYLQVVKLTLSLSTNLHILGVSSIL